MSNIKDNLSKSSIFNGLEDDDTNRLESSIRSQL